jgi:beta-xylosidase
MMNRKNLFFLFCSFVAAVATFTSCGGSDDPEPSPSPTPTPTQTITVSEPVVSDITTSSAVAKATVSPTTGVTKMGFCYSTSQEPTTADKTVTSATSDMNVTISGLSAGTTYHIRGFAESGGKTYYSTSAQFTTEAGAPSDPLASYVAPDYADDYRNISTWANRNRWNLANVHDPSVMLAEDGYYYMYCTDAGFGNPQAGHGHFHCRRSKNLVDWEYLGATMQSLPSWVKTKLNEIRAAMGLGASTTDFNKCGFWAPCARKVRNGLYRMYYVITIDGTINGAYSWGERAFIGLMETSNPANVNSWEDKGYVITNYSDKDLNYKTTVTSDNGAYWQQCYYKWNAIDPSYIITPNGEHWLAYGSWHSGFPIVQINPETGKPMKELGNPWGSANAEAYGKRIYTRKVGDRWQGSEAPEVIYRDGYYYLFLAYDALDVPYNTRVVRSKNVDGPYQNISGVNVSDNGGDALPIVTHPYKFSTGYGWVGISHCAVFSDDNGNWFYASQGRFPTTAGGNAPNAVMLGHVRSIRWTSTGWPVVMPERYGAVPQVPITEEEIVGTWEHIDLSYKYGEQKASTDMVFGADHKITSGPWKGGQWFFNAETNTLTANGVELLLQRECDWEATPRHATIVYAGINGSKTYWGKKK